MWDFKRTRINIRRKASKTLISATKKFALGKQYQHVSVSEFGNGNIANYLASQNSSFYGTFVLKLAECHPLILEHVTWAH